MQRRAKAVTLCAVLLALTVVLGALPYVFLLPLLVACVFTDWKTSVVTSLFFGVISLLYAFMGASLVSLAFVAQPWIPIACRLVVGLLARGAFVATDKCIKKEGRLKRVLPVSVAASVGSIANTGLIVACLALSVPNLELAGVTILVYIPVMLISGVIELIVNNLALVPLTLALNKIYNRKGV